MWIIAEKHLRCSAAKAPKIRPDPAAADSKAWDVSGGDAISPANENEE